MTGAKRGTVTESVGEVTEERVAKPMLMALVFSQFNVDVGSHQ
jgi:hypothetical protein